MHDIKIKDIIRECDGELIFGNEELICDSFSKDTRTIEKGDIYLGIKGPTFDGNLLYKEAFEKGASACILDDTTYLEKDNYNLEGKTIVKVENTVKALQKLAKYKRSMYDIPVVGITGSVGKTSTKDIIASVLSKKYKVLKTEGNLNNEIGMPLTILKLKNHSALVLEMGTDKFGDISLLTDIAKPTICVFTIIGTSHIANFKSRENILKGKMEMLEGIRKGGTIVLNNDNDLLSKWYLENSKKYLENGYNIITYGIDRNSKYIAKNIVLNEFESKYIIDVNGKNYEVNVPIGGKHFIYNSLAAISVGLDLGININEVIEGIKEFKLTKMRMDIIKFKNNIIVINDTYNASLDSMKSGLEYLSKIGNYTKIAILGDMLELGDFTEDLHRQVGKFVYENKIDKLVTVGNNSEFIAKEAKSCGMNEENIYVCKTNNDASKVCDLIIKENSAILIKASRGMKLEEIVNYIEKLLNKGDKNG